MPIYAYKCGACGHQRDALQKISDAPLTVCDACGQPAYVKQVTAAGFQLKGSGWYVTDFRNGGSASATAPATTAGDAAPAAAPSSDAAAAPAATPAPAAAPATPAKPA